MDSDFIRNFCIIAHIDHGKSTLADRLLEKTNAVEARQMVDQHLDSMELERERGITIKAQAVRLEYKTNSGMDYQLNLIDTPGHVDFSYEVSRSLAACEGALLVVDATQGIQAQTLANVYLALEHDLEVIPVINKIDLDIAEPERVSEEVQQAFGFKHDEIMMVSAKDGKGVDSVLEAIVNRIPGPKGNTGDSLRALVFDSKYDQYKGVIAYVRIVDGILAASSRIMVMSNRASSDVLEIGAFKPKPTEMDFLNLKNIQRKHPRIFFKLAHPKNHNPFAIHTQTDPITDSDRVVLFFQTSMVFPQHLVPTEEYRTLPPGPKHDPDRC